ncbi:MAG: hypothetical protein R3A52_08380 [Polyangiales bacterium]
MRTTLVLPLALLLPACGIDLARRFRRRVDHRRGDRRASADVVNDVGSDAAVETDVRRRRGADETRPRARRPPRGPSPARPPGASRPSSGSPTWRRPWARCGGALRRP